MIEVRVENLDAVLKNMSDFATKLQRRGVGQAARKAMNIARDAARAKAKPFDDPATPESVIWKNIITRQATKRAANKAGADLMMQVGIKGGAKEYVNDRRNRRLGRVGDSYEGGGDVFHWRFIEFGTKNIAARPFMRPALAENAQKVADTFTREMRVAVDRIARTGK